MSEPTEVSDRKRYSGVWILPELMRLFVRALQYYIERLEGDLQAIDADDELSLLFQAKGDEPSGLHREISRAKRALGIMEKNISQGEDGHGYDLDLVHGDVRYLKSVSGLYLSHIELKRNELFASRSISKTAQDEINLRITRLRELLATGVFKAAKPWPLLIEEVAPKQQEERKDPQVQTGAKPVRLVETIEIVDRALRDRCLPLLTTFMEGGEEHKFDTVIREATSVLEDRIRDRISADSSVGGTDLVRDAFTGESPPLQLSKDESEQDAAHLLFRGVFGFVRNPYHHRLIEDLTHERVVQMLGTIDYLLYLVETAPSQGEEDA